MRPQVLALLGVAYAEAGDGAAVAEIANVLGREHPAARANFGGEDKNLAAAARGLIGRARLAVPAFAQSTSTRADTGPPFLGFGQQVGAGWIRQQLQETTVVPVGDGAIAFLEGRQLRIVGDIPDPSIPLASVREPELVPCPRDDVVLVRGTPGTKADGGLVIADLRTGSLGRPIASNSLVDPAPLTVDDRLLFAANTFNPRSIVTSLYVVELGGRQEIGSHPIWGAAVARRSERQTPSPCPIALLGNRAFVCTGTGAALLLDIAAAKTRAIWIAEYAHDDVKNRTAAIPIIVGGRVFALAVDAPTPLVFELESGARRELTLPRDFQAKQMLPGGPGAVLLVDGQQILRVDVRTLQFEQFLKRRPGEFLTVAGTELLVTSSREGVIAHDLSDGRRLRATALPRELRDGRVLLSCFRGRCVLRSGRQLGFW